MHSATHPLFSYRLLFRSGVILTAGVLLGRLAGFAREVVLARSLGVGSEADIVVLLLTFPDLIINVTIGSAISSAFVPQIHRLPFSARFPYFLKMTAWVTGLFLAVGASVFVAPEVFAWILAPGLPDGVRDATLPLLKWTALILPLTALVPVSRSFLLAENKFTWVSLENLMSNLALVTGLVVFLPSHNFSALVGVLAVAALLRWLPQITQLLRLYRPRLTELLAPPEARPPNGIVYRYLQVLGAESILIALPFIARAFGSYSGEGAVSAFNYSLKLVEFPVAVGLSAFSLVLLPRFSQAFMHEETADSGRVLARSAFRGLLLVSIPLTVFLLWLFYGLRTPAAGFGNLDPHELGLIAGLCMVGLFGLPARGIGNFCVAILNTRHDMRSALLINMAGIIIGTGLMAVFSQYWGMRGAMAGLVGAYWVIVIGQMLVLGVKHRVQLLPIFFERGTVTVVAMSLVILLLLAWLEGLYDFTPGQHFLSALGGGALVLGVALLMNQRIRLAMRRAI